MKKFTFDKAKWEKKFGRFKYFMAALLFHLIIFLMIATWIVFRPPPAPRDAVFLSVAPPPPPTPPAPPPSQGGDPSASLEPTPQVTPPSADASILSTDNASLFNVKFVKIPVPNALPSIGTPSGSGSGNGSGEGSGNGAGDNPYGSLTGGSNELQGFFYDLKQTPDRKPTDVAEDQTEAGGSENVVEDQYVHKAAAQNGLRVLRSFVKTWDMDLLDKYYKAEQVLYTSKIWIPLHPSHDATSAYKVQDVVRARRWIVVYHAKIMPPDSGEYRFIGFADDFMVVRVDGQNVLDASLSQEGEGLDPSALVKEDVGKGPEYNWPLKCGKWFQMDQGTPVDIQVLIGEGPGGISGFLLMIQKQGDDSPVGDYPIFVVQDPSSPNSGAGLPANKKKMVFQVAP